MVMGEVKKHQSAWPSVLFGLAAIGVGLRAWFIEHPQKDHALDISVFDTYVVTPPVWSVLGLEVLFIFFGAVYFVFRNWFDSRLGMLHFLVWLPIPLFAMGSLSSMHIDHGTRRYYSYTEISLSPDEVLGWDTFATVFSGLVVIGLLIFVVNATLPVIRSLRHRNTPPS